MKTIHIDTERTWRGGEQQAMYLASGLHQRGVEVVAAGQPDCPFVHRAREKGLEIAEIPMHGEADPVAIGRLAGLFSRVKPDIIHMHTSHAHTLGVMAARLAGTGKTVVSRRVDFSIHRSRFRLNIIKYRFGVDRYVAISEGVRKVMVQDGIPAARIEIVPSGVDLSELQKTPCGDYRAEFMIPPDVPVVGDVAHFGWHKAQEVLVEACPYLWELVPDAHVFLVGDGDCRAKVEQVAKDVGADKRLVFTGHRTDARALIRWFDVFVMCSVLEGLCTSILDAHILGTPVVASRVGGMPEIVRNEDTGLSVPPRDPKALALAIARMIREPEFARQLNVRARALVEKSYSVDAMVEGTLNVYERMLAGKTG